jgi:hypothetical protein
VILFFSFQDRVLLTICLGLTSNLLISAFWVAGITGVSHSAQLPSLFLKQKAI